MTVDNPPVASPNVELVRSLYGAWERGERSAVDWAHPQIEFVIADGPAPGTWTGSDAMSEGFRELLVAWEDWRPHADEYRELDDQRVLVLDHFSARGRTSRLEVGRVRAQGAVLFHLLDGKVTRLVVYWDRDAAFADLGI
jgi:ketosteroid isomerase-like protein